MASSLNNKIIRAAGGVLWRTVEGGSDIQIAVIHRPRYDDWSIPKGKLAAGESEIDGAVREVFEETGFRVHVGRPLGEVRYQKTNGRVTRPKVVRYWAMRAAAGCFMPTREVDQMEWVSPDRAKEMVTHDHDRDLIDRFVRGPAVTGCVLLVRHASAGERAEWKGDDRDRPLDEIGWRQAEELVRILSRFEVETIVSANFARCVQTVEPLAEALSISMRIEEVFAEDEFPNARDVALKTLRELGRTPGAVVVCSQGDVIPDLVEQIAAEDHIDLPDKLQTKKGSTWILTFASDRLLSADYLPAPRVE